MPDEFDDAPELGPGEEFLTSVNAMLDYLKDKVAIPAEDFYALEGDARIRAFTVSGIADLDMMGDVWEAIESAVKNGETLADFRERVGELLEDAWGGKRPYQLETIFRTNIQTAYSAGRFQQNNHPAVKQTHPYSRYDVVDDDRTSDVCEPLIGTVLPSDDPFVLTHQPPLHFNCRTDVVAVTEEEARDIGVDEEPPDIEIEEGFGNPFKDWKPDLTTRPAELANIFERKIEASR